jgi:hypothetical protein
LNGKIVGIHSAGVQGSHNLAIDFRLIDNSDFTKYSAEQLKKDF